MTEQAQVVAHIRILAAIMESLIQQKAPESVSGYVVMDAILPFLPEAHRTEALEEDCRNLRDAANGLAEHVERLQGQLRQAETHDYENCYVIDCGICKGIGKMAKRMVELWKGERTRLEAAQKALTLVKTANDDDSWHDAMDAVDAALAPVSTQEVKS